MIHLVTTADTEILACARVVERLRRAEPDFPAVRCFNPGPTGQGEEASVDELVDAIARDARVVVCRVLGGRRGWQPGFDLLRERCRQQGIALVALGGEAQPDAERTQGTAVTRSSRQRARRTSRWKAQRLAFSTDRRG